MTHGDQQIQGYSDIAIDVHVTGESKQTIRAHELLHTHMTLYMPTSQYPLADDMATWVGATGRMAVMGHCEAGGVNARESWYVNS